MSIEASSYLNCLVGMSVAWFLQAGFCLMIFFHISFLLMGWRLAQGDTDLGPLVAT